MNRWVLGHKIMPQQVSGDYDLVTGETPAHTPGPPPHLHKTYHEVFLVTEGEMEFVVNGEPKSVRAGESVNLSPNSVHTFSNNSDNPCKWVNIHSPKGFLSFFEDMGVSESEVDAHGKSVDGQLIQKVMETAAQYDMIIKTP
jgi:mannose-6-phosphate isomerase-like protein (cupin superfamily)